MSAALQSSMDSQTPFSRVTLPPGYTLLKRLGEGAFATVYKARREDDGKIFAIKIIDMKDMDAKGTDAVAREVQCHGSVDHPNIVRYEEGHLDEELRTFAMIMEYCPGNELSALLDSYYDNQQHLPEVTIWSYMRQLVAALHHCHEPDARGSQASTIILHRDIKPANILMNQDRSQLKLAEFGLSREVEEQEWATSFCGTPDFMPPEMCAEAPADIRSNEAGDVWSLGCVLFELCTLRPLFVEADDEQLKKMIRDKADPLIPSMYSDELWKLLRMMLMTNPAERPSTADLLELPGIKYVEPLTELVKTLDDNRILREELLIIEREISTRDSAVTQFTAAIAEHEHYADHVERKLQAMQHEHEEAIAFYDRECAQLRKQIDSEKAVRLDCKIAYDQSQQQIVQLQHELHHTKRLQEAVEERTASLDSRDRMLAARERAFAAEVQQHEDRMKRSTLVAKHGNSVVRTTHAAPHPRLQPVGLERKAPVPTSKAPISTSSLTPSRFGTKRGASEAKPLQPTARQVGSAAGSQPKLPSTTGRFNKPLDVRMGPAPKSKVIIPANPTIAIPSTTQVTSRMVRSRPTALVVPDVGHSLVPRKVVANTTGARTVVVKATPVSAATSVIRTALPTTSGVSRASAASLVPRQPVVSKPTVKKVPIIAVEVPKRVTNIKPTSSAALTASSALTMSTKRKLDQFRGALNTASASVEAGSCRGLGVKRLRV